MYNLKIEKIDNNSEVIISHSGSFGGYSCDKFGMLYKGCRYIVKLPDDFSDLSKLYPDKKFSHYSMDPICEWLGAQIFSSVEIPVQNVQLFSYGNKIVAACEDFIRHNEMLVDFRSIFDTYSKNLVEPLFQDIEGRDVISIDDIMKIINDKYYENGIEEFFWEMFVIDALIGNNDRNMGNWGILVNNDLSFSRIAPVFDNGSSFSKGWSDAYISELMTDLPRLKEKVCNIRIPFVDGGEIITHQSYLIDTQNDACKDALLKIVPQLNLDMYYNAIDSLASANALSPIKADFYSRSLDWRYSEILEPAFRLADSQKMGGPA